MRPHKVLKRIRNRTILCCGIYFTPFDSALDAQLMALAQLNLCPEGLRYERGFAIPFVQSSR